MNRIEQATKGEYAIHAERHQVLTPYIADNIDYVLHTFGTPSANAPALATAAIVRFILLPLYKAQARLIHYMVGICTRESIRRMSSDKRSGNEQRKAQRSSMTSMHMMIDDALGMNATAVTAYNRKQGTPRPCQGEGGMAYARKKESPLSAICRYLVPQYFRLNISNPKFPTPHFLTKSSLVYKDIEDGHYEHI
jgi:hypothetical protein